MLSKGVWHMLLATFFFAVMNVCIKEISHIPVAEIILFRSVITLFLCWVMLKRQDVSIWGNHKGLLLACGVTGTFAMVFFFITLQSIPLATAATLQYLSPVFTTLLGIFIVKEKVRAWQWVFFLVSFGGVFLIEGADVRVSPLYLVVGVSGALVSGIAYNIIRKLNTREHPLVIVAYVPLVAVPLTGAYSVFNWVQPQGWDWAILLLIGVLTQLGHYYMTVSYQTEELSKVSIITFLGVIFAIFFGFTLYGETFETGAYLGMAMVVLGVILNVYYKNKLTRKATLSAKQGSV